MSSIDDRIEKAITQLIRDGKHTNQEIGDKYAISPSAVKNIQDKHKLSKKNIVQESHLEAQKASTEKIKEEVVLMKKRELNNMNIKQITEVYSRSAKQNELMDNYEYIKNITMGALESRFGGGSIAEIGEVDRDDLILLKTSEEIIGKYHDRVIGNGDPLIPRDVNEVQSFGVPLPTKEFYGDGDIIEVEN